MIGRIFLILVLQTAALAGMVAMKQWTLATGTPILLKTEPIDPRSLFRGDYVVLNYSISRLELDQLGGDDDFARNQDVYVVLEPGAAYWEPESVHHHYPAAPERAVVMRGEVFGTDSTRFDPAQKQVVSARAILVRYGIENYFVPEGEGRALERGDAGPIDVQVVVDARGNSAIAGILVNGVPRYRETLLQ